MNADLPVIDSCDDCGACCIHTPVPPFQPGEEISRDVPAELLVPIRERIAADQQFEMLSCVWYDELTKQCRHYEYRPTACREFEPGSDLCRISRWDCGVDH